MFDDGHTAFVTGQFGHNRVNRCQMKA